MSLFDEAEVVAGHQKLVKSIAGSMETLHACTNLVRKVLLAHSVKSGDETAVSQLGFRIVNDIGAATKLAECGYFPQASAQLRDLAEIGALALYFSVNLKRISVWRSLDGKQRYKQYSMGRILQALPEGKRKYLNSDFDFFSEAGTHPSSRAFGFHEHDGALQIGPHINSKYFVLLHQDLARLSWHVTDAAGECWVALTGENIPLLFPSEQRAFADSFSAWEQDGLPVPPPVTHASYIEA